MAKRTTISSKMYQTPFYKVWSGMKTRCNNTNEACYERYGGRGIKVCQSWSDFDKFYQDMYDTYAHGLQLDRIDNNGNYEPDNCRWVTPKENSRNTRNNRYITYKGMTKCVNEWAEYLGVKRSTFSQRFYVYKWPLDRLIGEYLG